MAQRQITEADLKNIQTAAAIMETNRGAEAVSLAAEHVDFDVAIAMWVFYHRVSIGSLETFPLPPDFEHNVAQMLTQDGLLAKG